MAEPLPSAPALPLLSSGHPCTSTSWLQPNPSSNHAQDAATAFYLAWLYFKAWLQEGEMAPAPILCDSAGAAAWEAAQL